MKKIIIVLLAFLLTACSNNIALNNNLDNLQTDKANINLINTNQINEEKQMTQENNDAVSQEIKEASSSNLALIKTSLGDIKIKLYEQDSPITVANFKKYVGNKYYDGTIFHRVMDGFMIQGGGFDKTGNQKETLEPIKNEAKNGLSNKRGTLAMARTNVVDSATSQFFINLVDNDFLNHTDDANYGYAVFGEVIEGMDVVDEIAKVQTENHGMYQNWPVENVVINSIEMVE